MDTTDLVLRVMIMAMAGWLACCHRIVHSSISVTWRRRLIVPLWFVWMGFGLGGPVYAGTLALQEGVQTGAGFTVGMMVYLVLQRLNSRTRAR